MVKEQLNRFNITMLNLKGKLKINLEKISKNRKNRKL
jgi:hypothetical protein